MPKESIDKVAAALAFARQHKDDDPHRLLLDRDRYPDVDIDLVVWQLEAQRKVAEKWPFLLDEPDFAYPARLSREQSSSQATALYKANLLDGSAGTAMIADLTGGMGIDDIFFARSGATVDYVERDSTLCSLARHNFTALGLDSIRCHCADCQTWLASTGAQYDMIYIDPARRDTSGRKTVAFEDCTPNLIEMLDQLLDRCRRLLIKASPMADISACLQQLRTVKEVHVVAVAGECKELLFVVSAGADEQSASQNLRQRVFANGEPLITCVNLNADGGLISSHRFHPDEEHDTLPRFCDVTVGRYLYEPHAALMKAGPWGSICRWYDVLKLDRSTHLYTSNNLVSDFPGRIFTVLEEVPLRSKEVLRALARYGSSSSESSCSHSVATACAHVVTRNYPESSQNLMRRLKIKEGGEIFIVATTVLQKPKAFLCYRIF